MTSTNSSSIKSQKSISILAIVGYVLWGFSFFIAGLYLFFPRDQLRVRIEQELSLPRGANSPPWATGYSVRIEKLDIHFFRPGIHLGNIRFQAKPVPSTENGKKSSPSKPWVIDSFDLYISWWDLLLGRLPPPTIWAELKALGGEISLELEKEDSEGTSRDKDPRSLYRATLKTSKLQFAELSKSFSFPMLGDLEISADITIPSDPKTKRVRFGNIEGQVKIKIEGFSLSDGKTKIPLDSIPEAAQPFVRPMLQKFSPLGIPIPKIQLGQMNSRITIQKNQVSFDGWQFRNDSSAFSGTDPKQGVSMNFLLDGSMSLNENIEMSSLNLYLRIGPWRKLFDRLIDEMKLSFDPQKDAGTQKELEEQLRPIGDLVQMQERADGFLGFFMSGPLAKPSTVLQKNNPEKMTVQSTLK